MTDHAALSDAIVGPAFGPDRGHADGDAATDHLASCTACRATLVGIRADEAAIAGYVAGEPSAWVRRRVVGAAEGRRSALRGVSRLLVVGLLAIGAIAGGVAGAGALMGLRTVAETPPVAPSLDDLVAGKRVIWKSAAVILGADAVSLTANGRTVHPGELPVSVDGDPGSLERASLEVRWIDGGIVQRLTIYVAADATAWWISEVRATDPGGPNAKWATVLSPIGRRPLGVPYRGDLVLDGVSENDASRVQVNITGAVLLFVPQASFVQPPLGAPPLTSDPFAAGGALHCSGILQLAPKSAERDLSMRGIRLSWRYETQTSPNEGFSDIRLHAPASGWISDTELGSNGELIIFVQDPARPMADPVPFPADCAAAPSG